MLNNDLNALGNVGLMQFHKTSNLALGGVGLTTRIGLDLLVDLIKSRVFRVVLQHIQNEALFNGLFHGVDMKRFTLPLGIQSAKELDRGGLWRSSKREHRHIGLLAVAPDFIGDHVLHIPLHLFTGAEGHGHRSHILTGGGRMGFINNHSKPLIFQVLYTVHDIGELLNGSCNNFGIAIQCNRQISRVTLIVHHADETGLVLHAHDGFLQLAIHHHAVSHNDDVVKDDLVISVMQ